MTVAPGLEFCKEIKGLHIVSQADCVVVAELRAEVAIVLTAGRFVDDKRFVCRLVSRIVCIQSCERAVGLPCRLQLQGLAHHIPMVDTGPLVKLIEQRHDLDEDIVWRGPVKDLDLAKTSLNCVFDVRVLRRLLMSLVEGFGPVIKPPGMQEVFALRRLPLENSFF